MARAIPVVMYHSVGRTIPDWQWTKRLTIDAAVFENHLRCLAQAGYRTVDLSALQAHIDGTRELPTRTVVLTLDDGYVDNWTYVVPLLQKYKMTATVAVAPEFVDPRDVVRPSLSDVWQGRVQENELEVRGFMSWPELRAASESGALSVQSHAMTHTWYPCGPEVVDFHHPKDGHYWLDWNQHPEDKPFYLRDPNRSTVPWGTPVYEHEQSLTTTRYFPPESEATALTEHVTANGGEQFFSRDDWRDELRTVLAEARDNAAQGRFEPDTERDARYLAELTQSKQTIEQRVGARADFLVWPTHAYSEAAMNIARGHFKAVTIAQHDIGTRRNRPGEDPQHIVRMGVPLIPHGDRMLAPGGQYLIAYLGEFCGSLPSRIKRMVLKRFYKARGHA